MAPPEEALLPSNKSFSIVIFSQLYSKNIAPPQLSLAVSTLLSLNTELLIKIFLLSCVTYSAPPLSQLPFTNTVLLILIFDTEMLNILAPLSPLIV